MKKNAPNYFKAMVFTVPFIRHPKQKSLRDYMLTADEEKMVCANCPECQAVNMDVGNNECAIYKKKNILEGLRNCH